MHQGIDYEIQRAMGEAQITETFVSRCTIERPSGNFGPSGAPDNLFVAITGLVDIPCMAPPPSALRIQATEQKALAEIMASEMKHVLLNGWYPAIEGGVSHGWRAVIDGTPYDILGAESDSQGTQTRMEVRLASI